MSTFAFTLPEKQLTWLITGCSSGLGLALARTIIADGRHRVIATSRDPSRTPDLVAEVERSGNRWLPLDVTVPGVSEKLVTDLESEGVEIDVLVNNAGYCLFGPIETATDSEINKQLEIQFLGPLRLIRSVVPYMRERRFGVIVNMSSGAALMGNESMGIYAGAKAGLDGLTRVLAKEIAPFNVRALTVVLGTYNTSFGQDGSRPSVPVPDDYTGTMVDRIMSIIHGGSIKPNGDKDKAMRAVYEVVIGEGKAGKGNEAQLFLPLGPDMVTRVGVLRDHLQQGLDAFADTAKGVALEA